MYKVFSIIITIFTLVTVGGCNNKKHFIKLPKSVVPIENQINLFKTNNLCVVYYFDGNCSFCYSNVLSIEDMLPKIVQKIYIYYGTDTSNINYNMELLDFPLENCFFDSTNCFIITNPSFQDKSFFLIDSSLSIIGAWETLDNDLFNKAHQLVGSNRIAK